MIGLAVVGRFPLAVAASAAAAAVPGRGSSDACMASMGFRGLKRGVLTLPGVEQECLQLLAADPGRSGAVRGMVRVEDGGRWGGAEGRRGPRAGLEVWEDALEGVRAREEAEKKAPGVWPRGTCSLLSTSVAAATFAASSSAALARAWYLRLSAPAPPSCCESLVPVMLCDCDSDLAACASVAAASTRASYLVCGDVGPAFRLSVAAAVATVVFDSAVAAVNFVGEGGGRGGNGGRGGDGAGACEEGEGADVGGGGGVIGATVRALCRH